MTLSAAKKHELLQCILSGRLDLEEMCAAQEVSLEQLAAWASQTTTLSRLYALRHLADLRTQLMLSRYRAHAAARLIELTSGEESAETARKACVDLLRLNVTGEQEREPAGDEVARSARSVRVDTERVRSFLAELGRADEADAARDCDAAGA